MNIKIKGITLLSEEEYEACKVFIPKIPGFWWLRSTPVTDPCRADVVTDDGTLGYYCVDHDTIGVRPVLIRDLDKLPRGSKIEFAEHMWTVISADMMLCDDTIGNRPFNRDSKAGNEFEYSSVRAFIEIWLESHDDPISLDAAEGVLPEYDYSIAKKRIEDLLNDLNPAEIAGQIQMDNLTGWIKTWKFVMHRELNKLFGSQKEDRL